MLPLPLLAAVMAQPPPGRPPLPPPEDLPSVTVRWLDPSQQGRFAVEGARYACVVETLPARIAGLMVDGKGLLGPDGMTFGLEDAQGTAYQPAPVDVTPVWDVWRGRRWQPAADARARMNVWNAGPYYWDAHLLDIPLMTAADVGALRVPTAGPPLVDWDFSQGLAGWQALHNCTADPVAGTGLRLTLTGDDPYLQSPPINVPGPVVVALRLRQTSGGGAAFYWTDTGNPDYGGDRLRTFAVRADGEWHEYAVRLEPTGSLTRLRFDPPGSAGVVDLAWVRVLSAPDEQTRPPAPVRGEVVFHAHADRLHVEFRTDPVEGRPRPRTAVWKLDAPGARVLRAGPRPIVVIGQAAILGDEGSDFDPAAGLWRAPLQGDRPGALWVIRPLEQGADPAAAFAPELDPLPSSAVSLTDGHWHGYDPASGLYVVENLGRPAALSFEDAYKDPPRRLTTGFAFRNTDRPHTILVKGLSHVGCLEAAVLTDAYGFLLPVPVQVAKNFAGELEEPDDAGFGNAFFPLRLDAGEQHELQIHYLVQNWGIHPLKQVSSIRFFHIYWHLSTGASETTCFSHDWMRTADVIFRIPDFRPLSGPFWTGQPQHDCQQWPGFLQYNGTEGRLMYDRTTFRSISPCLARFTMSYHTADDTAAARVDVMEIPQRDEMRTFLRLRYDWTKPCEVRGDARLSFRWLNMWEKHRPAEILWTGPDGGTLSRPVEGTQPLLLGEPLGIEAPFVAAHGQGDNYHSVVLVTGFQARLGGRDLNQVAASAAFGDRDGSYWLTVPWETLTLQPGDFLEAEVMLLPHGEPTIPTLKPERERQWYGLQGPRITACSIGTKRQDFPAVIAAQDEVAAFSLEGGQDNLPVIVEGFREPGVPILWREGLWQDYQVHGGEGYQVEPDGRGGYRFTFVVPHRFGQKQELLVTRAGCTTGISRVFDRNGRVALQVPREGRFTLKAPAPFGPGRNVLQPDSGVVTFEGTATEVRELPLSVADAQGAVTLDVEAFDPAAVRLRTSGGPLTLRIGGLGTGATYRVVVAGREETRRADGGGLEIKVPAPGGPVNLTRL